MKTSLQVCFSAILSILLSVTTNTASGQVIWDGGGDGISWTDADNWDTNVTPTSADSVEIGGTAAVVLASNGQARGVLLDGTASLTQNATLTLTTSLSISSGCTFTWVTGNLSWPHIYNDGIIQISTSGARYLTNNIMIHNHIGSEIIQDAGTIYYFTNGKLINDGKYTLLDGADISISGGANHLIENTLTGEIKKTGSSNSTITIDINNYGKITSTGGTLNLNGEKFMYSGTDIDASVSSTISLNSKQLHINGTLTGSPIGHVLIDCPFDSDNGILNFDQNGIEWHSNSLTSGDTLKNIGLFNLVVGGFKYLRDNTILVNFGTLTFGSGGDLYITDGQLINEGQLELESAADLLVSGGSEHLVINKPAGSIIKTKGTNSTISNTIINHGVIQCDSNSLILSSTKLFEQGTILNTNSTSTINLTSGVLSFNALVTGNASGAILIDCPFESNNGSIDFSQNGLQWYRNSFQNGGTLTNLGLFTLIIGNYKYMRDNTKLVNSGTLTFKSGGDLYITDGQLINEGQLELENAADLLVSGGSEHLVINNPSGSIIKTKGTNSTINNTIINHGVIQSDSNTLILSGPKLFEQGTILNTNSTSAINLTLDILSFNGLVTGNASGAILIDCPFESNNGSIDFSQNGLQWLRNSLQNGGTLTNLGLFTLIAGNYKYLRDSVKIQNIGTMEFEDNGTLYLIDGSIFNHGQINLQNNSSILKSSGSLQNLQNEVSGTIQKASGSTSTIDVEFTNKGLIQCDSNILRINGIKIFENGSQLLTAAGATIDFRTQPIFINGLITGDALGTIISTCDIYPTQGSISIDNNGWEWQLGNLKGGDTLTNFGNFNIIPGNFKYIRDSTVFINENTTEYQTSGTIYVTDGTIINRSEMHFYSGSNIYLSSGSIHNLINESTGAMRKKVSVTKSNVDAEVVNYGLISVEGSTLNFNTSLINKNSGILAGISTIELPAAVDFSNSGNTSPGMSPGLLNIIGAYEQDSSGFLEIELNGITAGTQYDQINSTLAASVEGNINLTLGFQPVVGNTFDIVTAPSFTTCDLVDTITLCYDDEINVFTVHCLPTSIQLRFEGFQAAPQVICRDYTGYLNAAGALVVSPDSIFSDMNVDCGYDVFSLNKTTFDCSDVGTNTVTLTATSLVSESTSCMATVTVFDTISPTMQCVTNPSFYLDPSGALTITTVDIDNGSADACSVSLSLDVTDFDCSDIGFQTVKLTGIDPSGNSSTCTSTIEIIDSVAPVMNCHTGLLFYLNISGMVTITPNDIDNNSADACTALSLTLNKTVFNCSEVGMQNIILTGLDDYGNSASCTTSITIIDTISPTVIVQDISVTLDANDGTATITSAMVNVSSFDNCGIQQIVLSQYNFDCSSAGIEIITVIITDVNGNSASKTSNVTVIKPGKRTAWVSEMATGNNNGLSKNNAFNSIQNALEATGCITDVNRINLVEGNYLPTDQGVNNRLSSFNFDDSLQVFGGYPFGAGSRDASIYESILSGNMGSLASQLDNAYHVVTVLPTAQEIRLDGVIIEKGNANGVGHQNGGGLFADGPVKLEHVTIRQCSAANEGAGLYVRAINGNATLVNNNTIESMVTGKSNLFVQSGASLLIQGNADIE